MLQALGLDEKTSVVYEALLAAPAVDTGGLSGTIGLSDDDVRIALEALADLGLARRRPGPTERWEAVNPHQGLAAIVRRQEEELARRTQAIAAAKAAAAAYAAAHSTFSPIERFEGWETVRTQAHHLARNTAETLQLSVAGPFTPASELPAADDRAGLAPTGFTVAAGVQMRVICHESRLEDPAGIAHMAQLADAGAEVRLASALPPALLISDKHAALIPSDPAALSSGAICVREPAIVAILAMMFGAAWDAAKPLGGGPAAPPGVQGITADERALLALLAEGLTDEAVARRLGLSVRTTRRQVAMVMDKLGAASRFQAGHRAGERGWL